MASLRTKLAILAPYLDDPDVTEIAINHPSWVWVGRVSQRAMYAVHVPELSYSLLSSLAELVASYTDQEIQRHTPILSATIPVHRQAGVPEAGRGCYRIQILLPPVVASHTVAMSIRKQFLRGMTLADYQDQGAFDTVNAAHQRSVQSQLCALYKTQQWSAFLRAAVVMHQNIVISAGTNAGKTTLLNTLLHEVPSTERIITIEDAREITLAHPNCLHLLYSRGGLGVGQVTPIDLLQAVLRLAPDRAIMGELRGEEAYAYLELLNSGHQGSMTTIHADSPERMFDHAFWITVD
jgi:type IV secretion system protein VirB11